MAIIKNSNNNLKTIFIGFSSFLGMMYESTSQSEAAIAEVRAEIGEVEWLKGFSGNRGSSASAKAIAMLKDKGVTSIDGFDGRLTSAKIDEVEVKGNKLPYLVVRLRDDDSVYHLKVSLAIDAAQQLVRKLVNAKPSVNTVIKIWSQYEKSDSDGVFYANQYISMKQDDVQVPIVPASEGKNLRIAEAVAKLEAAGIPASDKETYAKRKANVSLEYHTELMAGVSDRFAKFFEQRDAAKDAEQNSASDANEGQEAQASDEVAA